MTPQILNPPSQAEHLTILRRYAFYLGLSIYAWDRESIWMQLMFTARAIGMDSADSPSKKPKYALLNVLFAQLAREIEVADLTQARSTLSAMLSAAHLA